MEKSKLKIIKGGLCISPKNCSKKFIDAYVTDTRLMGVVGMYAHYKLTDGSTTTDFHQFFYLDCEDLGFENCRCMRGSDFAQLLFLEQFSISGLGGQKVSITEEELKAVLQHYAEQSLAKGLSLPPNSDDYDFLLDGKASEAAYKSAFKKQCAKVKNPYHCINFFLMRIFAGDRAGAEYLTKGRFPLNLFPEVKPSTLCKNSIKKSNDGYIAESLIECENDYLLIRTALEVSENPRISEGSDISESFENAKGEYMVSSFERLSFMRVSSAEAAMMLSKSEFVTVFEIVAEEDILDEDRDSLLDNYALERIVSNLAANSMATIHDNGRLFLSFNPNNNHVEKQVYMLSDDVRGIYFISNAGELILAAYSEEKMKQIENEIWHTSLADKLITIGKYKFREPVIYEFMESDFDYFEEFIAAIAEEDE